VPTLDAPDMRRADGFKTLYAARDAARAYRRAGATIAGGGESASGGFGFDWTGRVDDTAEAIVGTFYCGRCAGTGQFITGTLNGKPTGPGGDCFRCNGRGKHTQADRKRNAYHDPRFMVRGMFG